MELNKVEKEVLMTLINACLSGMGGEKPSDLWEDFYTWVEPKDLVDKTSANLTLNQAKGYFSDFMKKGLINEYDKNERFLNEDAVREAEKIWN